MTAKLNHNLFVVKGLTPTVWERLRSTVTEEGVKLAVTVCATVLAAAIIFYLGLKAAG